MHGIFENKGGVQSDRNTSWNFKKSRGIVQKNENQAKKKIIIFDVCEDCNMLQLHVKYQNIYLKRMLHLCKHCSVYCLPGSVFKKNETLEICINITPHFVTKISATLLLTQNGRNSTSIFHCIIYSKFDQVMRISPKQSGEYCSIEVL